MEGQSSEFLEHTSCKHCSSSDAAALYTDGHIHCFSCGRTYGGESEPKGKRTVTKFTPLTGEVHALRKRGISEEVCKKFGYLLGSDGRKPVQIAPYFDQNKRLVGQKVRTPTKDFYVKGSVTGCLFGQQLWGSGGKRIVITEGEMDALSYAEATKCSWPVVSVPNGAKGAKKALQENLEWLESFDEIVIAFDNDDAGNEAANECSHLFTPGKSKVARLNGYKDFNEALMEGDQKAILSAVWNANINRPDGIIAGDDLWEVVSDTSTVHSYKYPWEKLNRVTHGLRKGELVTLTAGSGIGKSAFCREIAYDLAVHQDCRVGCLFLEENVKRTALGIMGVAGNSPFHLRVSDGGAADIDPVQLEDAYEKSLGTGRFFFFDHFGSTDIDNLTSRIRYLALGCNVDFVVLDHISIIISGLEVDNERRAIDLAMTELRTLVERTGVGLILVSHLKRPMGDQGHENGIDPQLAHLRGSHSIAQLSDMVIGLSRNQQCAEGNRDVTKLVVLKNRFSGETGYGGMVAFDHTTGRLSERTDDAGLNATTDEEDMF